MTIAERFNADSIAHGGKAHPFYQQGMQSLLDDIEKVSKLPTRSSAVSPSTLTYLPTTAAMRLLPATLIS